MLVMPVMLNQYVWPWLIHDWYDSDDLTLRVVGNKLRLKSEESNKSFKS
jgi:hypothetical protein